MIESNKLVTQFRSDLFSKTGFLGRVDVGFLAGKKVGANSVECLTKVEQVGSEIAEIVCGKREVVII